jgi:hypothetical protein
MRCGMAEVGQLDGASQAGSAHRSPRPPSAAGWPAAGSHGPPSWPPTWPPPTTTSRSIVRSPRTSTQAPTRRGWRPACSRPHRQPVAHRCRLVGRPRADVAPHLDVLAAVDLDEVEQPVEVEVDQRRPARARSGRCRPPPRLDERAVGLAESRLLGSRRRGRAAASTLPLATKRSTKPSLLTSANSACQAVEGSARRRPVRPVGGHAAARGRCRS